jgi:hypothetical protein
VTLQNTAEAFGGVNSSKNTIVFQKYQPIEIIEMSDILIAAPVAADVTPLRNGSGTARTFQRR